MFDFLGEIIEGATELLSEVFGGGIAGDAMAALAMELGTTVVTIGAGAVALGALIALAELTVDSIKKYLNSRKSDIEDALNNDPETLKRFLPKERLAGANKFSLSQMKKVVHKMQRTSDGQTVATVRISHPVSGVYLDAPIAGNQVKGVYQGLVL